MNWDEDLVRQSPDRPWEARVRRARERHNAEHAARGVKGTCLYCMLGLGELPPWPAPLQEVP